MVGLTQMLISRRLKATVLDSKSFLWDENWVSPSRGYTVTLSGPQGFALAQPNSGYLRNVAQTWRELNWQHPEMFGLCVVTLEHRFHPPISAVSSFGCNTDSQGRWSCQSSHALGSAPSPIYNGTRKVAEEQGMVGTMNTPTSSLFAKDHRNSDNSDGGKADSVLPKITL